MKFVIIAVLAVSSFTSIARVISTNIQNSNISQCAASTREVPGRNVNFGLPASRETIYCFTYHSVTVQQHILTDGESRGAAVPGSRPWTTRSEANNQSCHRDGIFSYGQDSCEAAREAIAAQ